MASETATVKHTHTHRVFEIYINNCIVLYKPMDSERIPKKCTHKQSWKMIPNWSFRVWAAHTHTSINKITNHLYGCIQKLINCFSSSRAANWSMVTIVAKKEWNKNITNENTLAHRSNKSFVCQRAKKNKPPRWALSLSLLLLATQSMKWGSEKKKTSKHNWKYADFDWNIKIYSYYKWLRTLGPWKQINVWSERAKETEINEKKDTANTRTRE